METGEDDEYKITNMQRCPYIHEMKERLLGEQIPMEIIPPNKIPTPPPFMMDQQPLIQQQQPVATVVKLNPDGYGSHTSPTHQRADRTPLMPKDPEDDFHYVHQKVYPKNAKTSLFIIMSFVYAKLLVVVCIAYVISDVVTHNIPLYYYEGFFTYLYGMSILFLLYVFCFLLQESSCCSGNERQVKPPAKQKAKEREKEKEKKKEEEKKKKEEKERQKKEKKEKEKDKDKKNKKQEKSTYRRNSEGVVDAGLAAVPVPVAEISQSQAAVVSQEQTPAALAPPQAAAQPAPSANNAGGDVEAGTVAKVKCKRKTTHNDQSHGSFFLRIGAIAFGLGTMIYTGLEFGVFFEIPFTSPCYMILRGVNPVLQMIFTFMQMYFIFMNSRLNIHRFKVIARFGLMHVVATNICVWIRTLVIEYLKEITNYHMKMFNSSLPNEISPYIAEKLQKLPFVIKPTASHLLPTVRTTSATLRNLFQTTASTASTTLKTVATVLPTTTSMPFAEESTLTQDIGNAITSNDTEVLIPQALTALNKSVNGTDVCGRVNIMGTIVQESGPYLYPFIIEYSLIGAAVIYVMWKHIGRNPSKSEFILCYRRSVLR